MNSETKKSAPSSGNGKAAWMLLGAAALLAAGSIAYNMSTTRTSAISIQPAPDAPSSIDDLIAAVEASSDDAEPWSRLGFARFQRREFAEAAEAYKRAVAIDPDAAGLWSALGEALVMANDASAPDADPLPEEALVAFEKAKELDPTDARARYFSAVKTDLDGDHAGAVSQWLLLLEDTPVGAPWESDLIRTIEQVSAVNRIDVAARLTKAMEGRLPPIAVPGSGAVAGAGAAGNVGGPTQAQIAAAQSLTSEEQQAQIESMVATAEAKLKDDPGNLNRWVMVIRSHSMLGNPAKAKATLEAAVAANPQEEAELRRQARALGVQ